MPNGWEVPTTLVAPKDDVVAKLFEPALSRANEYKRAVGYFSSAWIAHNATGLADFAFRGGVARWITSPHLSQQDWEAISAGIDGIEAAAERAVLSSVGQLETALAHDTLNTIAWMVADGLLQFRIAVASEHKERRDFHSKFGIFVLDGAPTIAFVGSMNESERGFHNHEVISVFHRDRPGELVRTLGFDELFESLWANREPQYTVFNLSEAARNKIISFRGPSRPYGKAQRGEFRSVLRPYQEQALRAWVDRGHAGIFEMATGTGKTITALACIEHALRLTDPPSLVLIACPFQHLVDQWSVQLAELGLPIVRAYESTAKWRPELANALLAVDTGLKPAAIVVTTYVTLTAEALVAALARHRESTLFIADECHYLGSTMARPGMRSEYPFRLGLSATPSRHYDQGGTESILQYFDGVAFEFGLERAIEEGHLVPYRYFPEFVELTWEESETFVALTEQLGRLMRGSDSAPSEAALRVAIKRARVLNNAEGKVAWLEGHLRAKPAGDWQHTLVYAGDQIFRPVTEMIGRTLGIRVHEFTSRQSNRQRASILSRFENRDLQVLAAMKCLDEGVDVPPTRTAYFLASSGNPREFVQRRGRVLRRSPGKSGAVIVDAIAVPMEGYMSHVRGSGDWRAARAALRSQILRVSEFSRLASNRVQADQAVFDLRLRYDLPISGPEDGVTDAF